MKNKLLIDEFGKLVQQISHDIEIATDKKIRTTHMFRLKQIEHALSVLKTYPSTIKSSEELHDVKGIGKGIMSRIDEILTTGKLSEITIQQDNAKTSKHIDALMEVYGIGKKKARELVVDYGIKSVNALKKAYSNGSIELNTNIAMGLKYFTLYEQHIPRSEMQQMEKYMQHTANRMDSKLHVVICGSYRRQKPFSNDIDCMLTHDDIVTHDDLEKTENYLQLFVGKMKHKKFIVDSLTGDDVDTKFMGFCQYSGELPVRRIDIRYIPIESYYPALVYFTGSGTFNQKMRHTAKKLGYKLNEYGLYKKHGDTYKRVNVTSEKNIFDVLGMEYVEPQNRL